MSTTELATTSDSGTIDLTRGYTSITATDRAAQKLVFAAVTSAAALKDHLGVVINVVDVISQPIQEPNSKGEIEEYTRITLIDDGGKAYSASSTGVLNALHTAFKIFGSPSQWREDGGLPIVAREQQSTNNKMYRFVTFDIAD